MLIIYINLGNSLSGKTTIYRQLKALNGYELKEYEKEKIRATILDNFMCASLLVYFRFDSSEIELSTEMHKVCIISDSLSI